MLIRSQDKAALLKFENIGRFRVVWLLRRLRESIWQALEIISSKVFTESSIRVSQIYSEKLMRRWKYEQTD